jgi:hypothetical protein
VRIPRGRIDNPDVIDQRGSFPSEVSPEEEPPNAPDPNSPPWDGAAPIVLKSDAQRAVRGALALSGVVAVGAFLLGRASVASVRSSRRRYRPR